MSKSSVFPLSSSLLVTYYEAGAALGAGITAVNTADHVPALLAPILVGIGHISASC